ncbi:MAG: hypothetical protein HOE26_07265 [Rhodospirillaceae bacterium]|jgi:hypothetical protein|nr:hypothetical protein [Rhodospirillaceae bacterium]
MVAQLPIEQIKEFLFKDDEIRKAIIDDYDLDGDRIRSPQDLTLQLVQALKQVAVEVPEIEKKDNAVVFEAAVLAIASSSSPWVAVQGKREVIKNHLEGYNPADVVKQNQDENFKKQLGDLLGGQAGSKNASYVIKWAALLADQPEFYQDIIVKIFSEFSKQLVCFPKHLKYPMAVLCLAGIFGNPVKQWKKLKPYKFPGMQVPIACEFLRNLGWSGFKPDRHVIRAIALWENDLKEMHGDSVEKAFSHIVGLIGTTSKTIICPIKAAIYAIYATPEGVDYSEADNLLWAFISNTVNIRQKDIVNVWLQDQLHMNQNSQEKYDKVTKLGIWPKSLICE